MYNINVKTNQRVCLFTDEELFLIKDGLVELHKNTDNEQARKDCIYLSNQLHKLTLDRYVRIT